MSVNLPAPFNHFYQQHISSHPEAVGIVDDGNKRIYEKIESSEPIIRDHIVTVRDLEMTAPKGSVEIKMELLAARSFKICSPLVILDGINKPLNIVLFEDSEIDCDTIIVSNVVFNLFEGVKLNITPAPLYVNCQISMFRIEEGKVIEFHRANL